MAESQAQAQTEQVRTEESVAEPQTQQTQHQQQHQQNGVEGEQDGNVSAGVEGGNQYQAQQERMKHLHKSCAEGDVMAVRGVLSASLDLLESIDPATGLTPMLQAIYASQVDVVRELVMAGAYPPPPTVTSDPSILAILYPGQPPANQFGMPPAPHFAPMPVPAQGQDFGYYGQLGGMDGSAPFPRGQQRLSVSHDRHSDAAKLPPTEVSKTIPCRNFPNCRYGDACVFQHPQQPPHFFPGAGFQPAEFVPAAFPGVPMYYNAPPPAPFVPLDAQSPAFAPPMPPAQPRQSVDLNGAPPVAPAVTSPGASNFVPIPAVQEGQISNDSPIAAQSPALPQGAHVFHPRAGPNGFPAPFLQPNGFDPSKKGHHAKRMSFGGMPKAAWAANGGAAAATNARQAALGSWNNGNPPACVFFQNSKCRNGEMCKFPHIMPDGTDCRHPDVIAGTVAAAPVSTNPNFRPPARGRMSVGNNFHFERQQHFMKVQAMRQQQAAMRSANNANGTASPVEKIESSEESQAEGEAAKGEKTAPEQTVIPAALKAQLSVQPAARGRSVPNTRAHSPNSNAGPGHRAPRIGGRPAHGGNNQAGRSTSIPAVAKEVKQKLPSADDFPALAGSVGSLNGDSAVLVKSGPYGNKTAAQVLSAPAPPKPVSEENKTEGRSRAASSVGQGVSTESDDEAVVISLNETVESAPKESTTSTPAPTASKGSISFASIAGKISSAVSSSEAPLMVSTQA